MATNPTAADTAAKSGAEKDLIVTGRELNTTLPPKHGDPTEQATIGQGESVVGVRVGSEAAVEDGTGPVLPTAGPLSEATRVRNKTLLARDERERKKRGLSGGPVRDVTLSMAGPFMVEREPLDGETVEQAQTVHSGSFTGVLPEEGLFIRPLTSEEEAKFFGGAEATRQRRANDLVAGSGVGGGGNPMHAGDARGTSSVTDRQVGSGGVTSKTGAAPGSRDAAGAPQGGGTTSKTIK